MLETLDYTIRIGSTPTFLYFDLYLYSAYAAHYVYLYIYIYKFMKYVLTGIRQTSKRRHRVELLVFLRILCQVFSYFLFYHLDS